MLPGHRAQVWRHHPSFRRPRHFHREPELNLVTSGHGVLSVGERELPVSAGDLVFLQPGQDHALLQESADFELLVVAISPELAERSGIASSRRLGSHALTAAELTELSDALSGLGSLTDRVAMETQLTQRFDTLCRRFAPSHVLCRRSLEELKGDLELSERSLARSLHAGPSSISRQVQHSLGVRLVEYRARLRLMEFVTRVDAGRPFTRAALESGFGSYAQCHRVFQRSLGCSPSAYFSGARSQVDGALANSADAD